MTHESHPIPGENEEGEVAIFNGQLTSHLLWRGREGGEGESVDSLREIVLLKRERTSKLNRTTE